MRRRDIPRMPEEYKGECIEWAFRGKTYVKRNWTEDEEKWAWDLYKKGYRYTEIAFSLDRDYHCVSIKMKRLKKRYNEYNISHLKDKYKINDLYIKKFNNNISILDLFCGSNNYYKNNGYKNVITNDINTVIEADYHEDAKVLLNKFIEQGKKFDIVDLDPFGASIIYLKDALKVANHGIIMTLGEIGHRRWKRLDFISKHYPSINTLKDLTLNNMIKDIIKIAKDEGVSLNVVFYKDWNNIARVWFMIEKK